MADPEKPKHPHRYTHSKLPLTTRAARFLGFGHARLPPPAAGSRSLLSGTDTGYSEKAGLDTIAESADQHRSYLSKGKAPLPTDAFSENIDRRRYVRTLPPWIHSLQQNESDQVDQQLVDSLQEPSATKTPHRNHTPASKSEPRTQAAKGRVWDHARSAEAITMSYPAPDHVSRWHEFIQSSAYAQPKSEEGEIVSEQWIRDNIPDLTEPWRPASNPDDAEKDDRMWLLSDQKRSATFLWVQNILMKNPFVPLVIRLTVMAFCLVALGLGVQIWEQSEQINHSKITGNKVVSSATSEDYICKQQASTYMAFIVDSFAVIYLLYITYDEYFSKPLGLRSSRDKMRLLFLDLWFIIFSAANLSLAFSTLTDAQWSCSDGYANDSNINNAEAARSTCVKSDYLCQRQKGLVTVLLIAEIAWVMTFAISTLRIVERIQR